MLSELAITPDVFLESSFADPGLSALAWERLCEPVLQECVVRDLYDGSWYPSLVNSGLPLSPRARHLLTRISRRLHMASACGNWPEDDAGWCAEALLSDAVQPLDCVVTIEATKARYPANPLVASIDSLTSHHWWAGRSCSVRLNRTSDDYLRVLGRVLTASNSLMFIDPYLEPTRRGYGEFAQLIRRCHRPVAPVRIEIHRGCSEGSGRNTEIPGLTEYKRRFEEGLMPLLAGVNVKIDVAVWPEFHDRYLISDLIGIALPNGFDTSQRPNDRTTWTRIGRKDRDEIQREFDMSNCPRSVNHGVFTLL